MERLLLAVTVTAALAGCAPEAGLDPVAPGDDTSAVTQNQSAGAASADAITKGPLVFGVRRDLRKCAFPDCGGYFLRVLNDNGQELYVAALDFKPSGLSPADEQSVRNAPDAEIALEGSLQPLPGYKEQLTLAVATAWLGLPGFGPSVTARPRVYAVKQHLSTCRDCPSLLTAEVNTGALQPVHELGLTAVLAPYVDPAWLTSRILDHGALVAGTIVSGRPPARDVLHAQQVFIRLPDARGACFSSAVKPACPPGEYPAYRRDENRCLELLGCAAPGACLAVVPSCSSGYRVDVWFGKGGCDVWACDPEFVAP